MGGWLQGCTLSILTVTLHMPRTRGRASNQPGQVQRRRERTRSSWATPWPVTTWRGQQPWVPSKEGVPGPFNPGLPTSRARPGAHQAPNKGSFSPPTFTARSARVLATRPLPLHARPWEAASVPEPRLPPPHVVLQTPQPDRLRPNSSPTPAGGPSQVTALSPFPTETVPATHPEGLGCPPLARHAAGPPLRACEVGTVTPHRGSAELGAGHTTNRRQDHPSPRLAVYTGPREATTRTWTGRDLVTMT